MKKLHSCWKALKQDYKITEVVGEGSASQVVRGRHRNSNKEVAVKKIDCSFEDMGHMTYVLRELTILR